jgi:hypothetical protein
MQPQGVVPASTPSRRGPFTVSMLLPVNPVCPGCGDVLSSFAVTFRGDLAVCPACSRVPDDLFGDVYDAMVNPLLAEHFHYVKGLRFWCPRTREPLPIANLLQRVELRTQPRLPGFAQEPPRCTRSLDVGSHTLPPDDPDSYESQLQRENDPLRS